jgi:dTDP-4-amino-4,6-dideoxygalactose transaminase
MSLTGLPPVRRQVPLYARERQALASAFSGYAVYGCGSGTEALALAVMASTADSSSARPEVVLPAYGCLDLLAACLYAGVRPRLVDTSPCKWGYDLGKLTQALSPDTVAIVAVNLLGVGDQALALSQICKVRGISLIQDSAQHLPQHLPASWLGDYVVLSFGRGKPLNLLGGGVLLHPPRRSPGNSVRLSPPWASLTRTLAGVAFNIATDRRIYGLSSRLLGARLGDTRYEPLTFIEPAGSRRIAYFESGVAEYCKAAGYDASIWWDARAEWAALGVEVLTCESEPESGPLRLRLALLAPDGATREAIVTALGSRGLGVSRMYNASLPRIPNVPEDIALEGPYPNAEELALRLFTLPTHSQVSVRSVRVTREIIRAVLVP